MANNPASKARKYRLFIAGLLVGTRVLTGNSSGVCCLEFQVDQAVLATSNPKSSIMVSRMMNFWILPVTVIGNSSTNRI